MKLTEIQNPTKSWLDKMKIKNYIIRDNGIVDVNGNVDISYKNLTKIPVQFGKVGGGFYCHNNKLTSLQGGPREVGEFFNCGDNNLTSLQGGPREVGQRFYCYNNKLTSLSRINHIIKSIGGKFDIENNPLKSNILSLLRIKGITKIIIDNKQVQEIFNRNIGDIWEAQEELMDAGLRKFAEL